MKLFWRRNKTSEKSKKEMVGSDKENVSLSKPIEYTIQIPTVYIGNCVKCRLNDHYTGVQLMRPAAALDFSKVKLCDDVNFTIDGDAVIANNIFQILGTVSDRRLAAKIVTSLKENRPVFSQIQSFDDKSGEIKIALAFYKIVNYDYTSYAEANDNSLMYEEVGYF